MPAAWGAQSEINSLDNYISVEEKLVHVSNNSLTKKPLLLWCYTMFKHNNLQWEKILNLECTSTIQARLFKIHYTKRRGVSNAPIRAVSA